MHKLRTLLLQHETTLLQDNVKLKKGCKSQVRLNVIAAGLLSLVSVLSRISKVVDELNYTLCTV